MTSNTACTLVPYRCNVRSWRERKLWGDMVCVWWVKIAFANKRKTMNKNNDFRKCIATSVNDDEIRIGLLIVKKVLSIRNDLAAVLFWWQPGRSLSTTFSWLWTNFLDQNVHCWSCETLFTIHWSHLRLNGIVPSLFGHGKRKKNVVAYGILWMATSMHLNVYKWRHSDVIKIKLTFGIHYNIPYKTHISHF